MLTMHLKENVNIEMITKWRLASQRLLLEKLMFDAQDGKEDEEDMHNRRGRGDKKSRKSVVHELKVWDANVKIFNVKISNLASLYSLVEKRTEAFKGVKAKVKRLHQGEFKKKSPIKKDISERESNTSHQLKKPKLSKLVNSNSFEIY